MTPEVTQQVSKLRSEFYTQFAKTQATTVTINKEKSYASTPPKVSWADSQQRLNYLCIYAYSAPDALVPDRPLVLRIGINLGAEVMAGASRGKGIRRYNQTCQFYLTLLPDEALALMPWILDALNRDTKPQLTTLPQPAHLLVPEPGGSVAPSFWTHAAQKAVRSPLSTALSTY
ncbi:hypothetical protein IQ254_22000 [Nodosilinea sp. LEGE 07088]|uniref:hypothetical protein n=1 Tax=Nodosilinea sp. LEGE 07088 TaxID=2777968 RepID=UPI00187E1205|nr:hypothetical protein [Nodosilinea sp. LEGE 07088]MBE9139835.1 hypothetical protein [Nodosilinea sp. LEGE 07088]